MGQKDAIRAGLEVDFSGVEAKLREADQRQREEDQKADALERRTKTIVERMKEAQASARELEGRVGSRVEDMFKDFGKFTAKSVIFDTLSNFSDVGSSDATHLAGIGAAALITGAMTLNPVFAALAAMGKAVDFLRDAQRDHQKQLDDIRKQREQDEIDRERAIQNVRDNIASERFKDLQRSEAIRTEVDKENNDLLYKTWQMTGGGGN